MPCNTTLTKSKSVVALAVEQKLQKIGKIKERYLERQADQKMKGNRKYILVWACYIFSIQWQSIRYRQKVNSFFYYSAIQSSKDIMNMVMYISFGPVFILYFCFSWKKVNIYYFISAALELSFCIHKQFYITSMSLFAGQK